MADEPEDFTHHYLRRIDAKIDRVLNDVHDLKVRMTGVEEALAGVNRRIDRIEERLDRIEKRQELVDEPTG